MEVWINWVAIALATIASMAVGFVWYAKPVFGKDWMKLVKLDEKKQQAGAAKAILQATVAGFISAYVLAYITYMSHSYYHPIGWFWMSDAMITAFWLGIGISATTVVVHNAFEQRPFKLTLITVGHQMATFLAMGYVIGLFKPSM